jgi:hypothetical protein
MLRLLAWIVPGVVALLLFAAAPAHAQRAVLCGCYCGKTTAPPCSDAACKAVCGYVAPPASNPAYSSPGYSAPYTPVPDYAAIRRAEEEAQRVREEAERAEEARRKAEQDRQFAEERDAAARSLKGVAPAGGGTGGANTMVLKGISPASGEMRSLRPLPEPALPSAAERRREELDQLIARDAEAIRRLGFARRAEDFAEWARLAEDAKKEFEGEVVDAIVGIAEDKTRGKLLDTFKDFDTAKASRLISWIRARGIKPESTALIAAIERVGRAPNKARVADDAEFIVKRIGEFRNAREASGDAVKQAQFISGLLESLLSDPRSALLITELKLTTAALYNNLTRRVARAEVERLTVLTEAQLKDLERLRQLMEQHVRERRDLLAMEKGR